MKPTNSLDLKERLESLKAGGISALALLAASWLVTLGNGLLGDYYHVALHLPSETGEMSDLAIHGAIAGVSGFLFGVTYRYIMRGDRNPHLQGGAVLAFGLVRGLAQVDVALEAGFPVAVWVFESVLLFAIAGTILNWSMKRNWIKPLGSA